MEASCTLPLITRFGFFKEFEGKKVLDGGFSKGVPYKYEDSKKIFINVLPEFRKVCLDIKNLKVLNITK